MRGLLIALGAGVGAPARYLIDKFVKELHSSYLPLETLLINTLGSFLLGLVINSHGNIVLILGTGFAGAFTTWSTFAVETHGLLHTNRKSAAISYLALTLVFGIAAAALGNAL
ncbi:MAG: fluoride efflux transporter CrcB [Actinomycetes bacterium]